MAKQIEGVYEKLYECAKKEFLQKGFKDASLRAIAKEAGTSTGSIYTRFQSKEGLFHAIVSPTVTELKEWFLKVQEDFHQSDSSYQKESAFAYSEASAEELVEYIYKHYDIFQLLVQCSAGTEFTDFLDEMVEMELDYTVKFMDCIGVTTYSNGIVTREFLHIITNAYFSAIFEIVRHDMNKEDGIRYATQIKEFYYAGFEKVFQWSN